MVKRLYGFFLVVTILSTTFFSYLIEEAHAIPIYPTMCMGVFVNDNPMREITQIYIGESLSIKPWLLREPERYDQVIYKLDGNIKQIVRGTNVANISFNNPGNYTLTAEIEGYTFWYYGNIYDADGNNLGGAGFMGTGGERYYFEDIKTTCQVQVEVLEKPTPVSSPITVKNATTGGTFSGTGTPTDPYLVPNRTNTRFSIALMSGESITSWMVNGSKVNRTLPQFDYTLWRIGEWTFGTEIKQADGSTREESVYLKSF